METTRSYQKGSRLLRTLAALVLVASVAACSTGAGNYDGFVQMVEHENEYSCAELIDAADGLSVEHETKARRLLDQIGCRSKRGTRTDQ